MLVLPPVPARVGPYRIIRRLQWGHNESVYEASSEHRAGSISLRVVRGGEPGSIEARAGLQREAQILAGFSHPNIVAVIEVGEHDGDFFVATEMAHGASLSEWSANRGWRQVVDVLIAAGRGLAVVHAHGFVHCHVSPGQANIDTDGRVRLIGFSDARLATAPPPMLRGNPTFTAPELLGGGTETEPDLHECDDTPGLARGEFQADTALSDQYSFCATAFEALYGVRPFKWSGSLALSTAIVEGRIRPPPADRKLPGWLHRAVMRGLSLHHPRRGARPPHAHDRRPRGDADRRRDSRPRKSVLRPVGAALTVTGILAVAGARFAFKTCL